MVTSLQLRTTMNSNNIMLSCRSLCSDIRWTAWFSYRTCRGFADRTPARSRPGCAARRSAPSVPTVSFCACPSGPENIRTPCYHRNSHRPPSWRPGRAARTDFDFRNNLRLSNLITRSLILLSPLVGAAEHVCARWIKVRDDVPALYNNVANV